MSAILATQPGPLTWVKPEIDYALERARSSLATYFGEPATSGNALAAALASIREVTGALQIIGMEPLGSFSKEVEVLLVALANQDVAPVPELGNLLDRASVSLEQYLSDLMAGAPDNAMCLLPVMDEMVRARGCQSADARVLFYPDLTVFPPPLASAGLLEGVPLCDLVKLQRGRFQRGMLGWLRHSEEGLVQMRDALLEIERAQPAPGSRAPWWVASAFVEGLLHGGLATTDGTKRAASRIDRYLAAFVAGAPSNAELMRELLFHLANCEPVTSLVSDVKSLYRLHRYTAPSPKVDVVEFDTTRLETVLRHAQDLLSQTHEVATTSGAGCEEAAAGLQTCLASLGEHATDLVNQPLTALIEALQAVAAALATLGSELRARAILEMAAAMICMERTLQDRATASPKAAAEFNAARERLLACISGGETVCPQDRGASSEPNHGARKDRELLLVVAREISATLQQVEESLDAFFRGHVPTPSLAQLPDLMKSVTGAFTVLGVESCAQLIDRCTSIVATIGEPEHTITEEETTLLAEGLSSVMLYVQAFDHGNREELRAVETILARLDAREALLSSSSVLDFQTTSEDAQPAQPGELDFDLLAALPEAGAISLEGEECETFRDVEEVTKAELAEILDHFDLSAIQDEPQAEAIALESRRESLACPIGVATLQELDASKPASCDLEPDVVEVDATAKGVDPEIVSIFIEEATELLDTMGALLSRVRAEPHNWDALTTLRRSYHTLKGSGRMAGLRAIGDAAWTVEALLNQWLDAGRPASEALIKLVALGRDLFTGWIADVAQHGRTSVRTASLSAQANRVAQELTEPHAGAACAAMASLDTTTVALADEAVPEVVTIGVTTLPATLFGVFVEEALQNVEALRTGLASLGPASDDEARDAVIRAAHTLGGIARSAGFPDIALVARVIENASLGGVDCPKTIELLQSAVATLESLVDTVASGNLPELSEDRRAKFASQSTAAKDLAATSPNTSVKSQQNAEAKTCDTETPSVAALLYPGVNLPQFENGNARADDAPQPEEHHVRSTSSAPQSAPDRRAIKDDIDEQLLPIFLDEVRDLGPMVGEDLRHLRNEPNDVAAFDSLRRVLHTIKGGARMVGAIRLGELVHMMEGRLEGALERGALSPDVLDMLEAEFDRLTCGFDALQGDDSESKCATALPEDEDPSPPHLTALQRNGLVLKQRPHSRLTFASPRTHWIACSIRPGRSASRAVASNSRRKPSSSCCLNLRTVSPACKDS